MNTGPNAFLIRNLAPPTMPSTEFAESAAVWAETGHVTAPRSNGHTATRLTGGKVLLAGGLGTNDTSISSADLYHPTTGLWSATGGMSSRRSWHSATRLPNGWVLAAGGADQQSGSVSVHSTAEVYRPSLGTWAFTDGMSTPRALHTATRLPDGRVLVVGGWSDVEVLATVELYDPVTKMWSFTGEMAVPRYSHTATRLPNGLVLVAGGYDATGTALASAELFDSGPGIWVPTGSMTIARVYHTAVRLTNANVLVAGGVNVPQPLPQGFPGLDGAELYDIQSGTWTVTGSMASPRFTHTLTRLTPGKALAAGGEFADVSIVKSTETYDLNSAAWTLGPDMPTPRATHTATRIVNGKILVAGGFFLGPILATTLLYAP